MEQEVTLSGMEKLVAEIEAKRAEVDAAEEVKKERNRELAALEMKMLETLKNNELDSYKGKAGTISIIHRTSFKTPKTPEEKKAFFDFLRERGVFDDIISVNSQTLNSFCKAEMEAAIADGRGLEFAIPGIGEPTVMETIGFRRAK